LTIRPRHGAWAILALAAAGLLAAGVPAASTLTGKTVVVPSATTHRSCEPLQAQIDASAPGSMLDRTGCLYEGSVTVGRPITIVGGTILVPPGETGITVTADNVTLDGLTIRGPQGTAFDSGEVGIQVAATATAPVRNLTIRSCEISSFGDSAISLLDVANVTIEHDHIHDVVYAGIIVMSGSGGTIQGNLIQRIGVLGSEANDGNAYGITLTRRAGTVAVSPPSTDFTVAGNVIEDVPTWHALDTHAGRRIEFTGNTVRRSSRAIFITTDGGILRASDITVSQNRLEAPTPVTFNLQAITTFASDNVTITANTAIGWDPNRFFEDYGSTSIGLVVAGNTLLP